MNIPQGNSEVSNLCNGDKVSEERVTEVRFSIWAFKEDFKVHLVMQGYVVQITAKNKKQRCTILK